MPPRDRGRSWRVVAGVATLSLLLVWGLVLVELFLDASARGLVTRLVAAAVLAMAAARLRASLRTGLEWQPPSTFDRARLRAEGSDREPSRLHHLEAEVRAATRHRRFFDAILWPDLVALAEKRTGAPARWLTRPPDRSFARGPSRAALERVIADIEGRR